MTASPAHTYIQTGLKLGKSISQLIRVLRRVEPTLQRRLPAVYSLNHICHYTGVNYNYLRNVCSRSSYPYTARSIPKRSGGFRFLHEPENNLKVVQKWVSSEILSSQIPHWRCFSFHPGASVVDCASEHCGSKWIIKIDIERFFESVTEKEVFTIFLELGYSRLVAFELARICTVEPKHILARNGIRSAVFQKHKDQGPYEKGRYFGRLPQGAPSSPMLSNLAFRQADDDFVNLSNKFNMNYTRYADDICLSTSSSSFCRDDAKKVIKEAYKIIGKHGYSPNKLKTKVLPPGSKKVVLGLLVNGSKPKLTKNYKARIESHLWGLQKFGPSQHAKFRKFRSIAAMLDHINGLISYAHNVDRKYAEKCKTTLKRLMLAKGIPYI